jgi:type I restriction enzyme M protein
MRKAISGNTYNKAMAPDVRHTVISLLIAFRFKTTGSEEDFFSLSLSIIGSIMGSDADLGLKVDEGFLKEAWQEILRMDSEKLLKGWEDLLLGTPATSRKETIVAALDYLETLMNERGRLPYYVTPKQLGIAMTDYLEEAKPESMYDPSTSSGGLLAEAARIGSIGYVHGNTAPGMYEKLMRLRLALSNASANVHVGHYPRTMNPTADKPFDIVIANPPYGGTLSESPDLKIGEEWLSVVQRLNRQDGAFLGHVLTFLADNGRAAVLLPTFYLSGRRVEELMYRILSRNLLDAVVLLPEGMFEGTAIAPALFLFNKGRGRENRVFLVDASKECFRQDKRVQLKAENLNRWIHKIHTRDDTPEEEFRAVTVEEIIDNGCDLQPASYRSRRQVARAPASMLLKECKGLEKKIEATRRRIDELIKWER